MVNVYGLAPEAGECLEHGPTEKDGEGYVHILRCADRCRTPPLAEDRLLERRGGPRGAALQKNKKKFDLMCKSMVKTLSSTNYAYCANSKAAGHGGR